MQYTVQGQVERQMVEIKIYREGVGFRDIVGQ